MTYAVRLSVFTPVELSASIVGAVLIQILFFGLLITAGRTRAEIRAKEEALVLERPIAVKPVLDDAPLLKLGGKKVRPKLPDMWKKQAPIPVQRFEEKSAPSPKAKDDPAAVPTSSVALGDAQAPPPDAELAKVSVLDADAAVAEKEPDVEGPGTKDGVKEGTETDPLKAHAMSLYMAKVLGWFNARFKPPVGQVPCEELVKLSSSVTASVTPDGTVTGYGVTRASGNATFDARVKSTMDGIVGQQIPPPPPNYPELLGSTVRPTFSGKGAKCN